MKEHQFDTKFNCFQVRLIKEVSVSLMGSPNLMDSSNKIRSTLLGCSLDVARKDPEFILKVINNLIFYCDIDLLSAYSLFRFCKTYNCIQVNLKITSR